MKNKSTVIYILEEPMPTGGKRFETHIIGDNPSEEMAKTIINRLLKYVKTIREIN